MILPLRRLHRVMGGALGVVLPVLFAAGIVARKPVPLVDRLPAELSGGAGDFGNVAWMNNDLWPGHRIVTSLRRDEKRAVAVELEFEAIAAPDVLLYWAKGTNFAGEGLPPDARLLGAAANRIPVRVPEDARGESGRLLLYSLADGRMLAMSGVFPLPND
jgi:hypothetical protein